MERPRILDISRLFGLFSWMNPRKLFVPTLHIRYNVGNEENSDTGFYAGSSYPDH